MCSPFLFTWLTPAQAEVPSFRSNHPASSAASSPGSRQLLAAGPPAPFRGTFCLFVSPPSISPPPRSAPQEPTPVSPAAGTLTRPLATAGLQTALVSTTSLLHSREGRMSGGQVHPRGLSRNSHAQRRRKVVKTDMENWRPAPREILFGCWRRWWGREGRRGHCSVFLTRCQHFSIRRAADHWPAWKGRAGCPGCRSAFLCGDRAETVPAGWGLDPPCSSRSPSPDLPVPSQATESTAF